MVVVAVLPVLVAPSARWRRRVLIRASPPQAHVTIVMESAEGDDSLDLSSFPSSLRATCARSVVAATQSTRRPAAPLRLTRLLLQTGLQGKGKGKGKDKETVAKVDALWKMGARS